MCAIQEMKANPMTGKENRSHPILKGAVSRQSNCSFIESLRQVMKWRKSAYHVIDGI